MAKVESSSDQVARFGPIKDARPTAKLQFHGPSAAAYIHPILDQHERPLISARMSTPDDPDAALVILPEQYAELDELRDRHALEYMRCHKDFVLLRATRQYGY
jgi:hypothetical protein